MANRFRANDFSMSSGATPHFRRHERWTITSQVCVQKSKRIPTSRAGFRRCMASVIDWRIQRKDAKAQGRKGMIKNRRNSARIAAVSSQPAAARCVESDRGMFRATGFAKRCGWPRTTQPRSNAYSPFALAQQFYKTMTNLRVDSANLDL